MKNIAIVGKMYAGKTTLAMELVANHGYSLSRMAGPLKAIAHLAYGEEVQKGQKYDTIDLTTGETVQKTGREILQGIGQSMKIVDRDLWLKCFINDAKYRKSEPYVVDDVRFGFEADYLRKNKWLIVKIETPEDIRIERAIKATGKRPTEAELYHESEREVDDIEVDQAIPGYLAMPMIPIVAHELVKGRAK